MMNTKRGSYITYKDVKLDFFQTIDNEAKAYFLGLLYADGCVYVKNKSNTVRVELKSYDSKILEIFRDHISPSAQVKFSKRDTAIFTVCQKEIVEQLIFLGCTPRKSLTLSFPTQVPEYLLSHFIRGYSDGDGSIYVNKPTKTEYVGYGWSMVSTSSFCNTTKLFLENILKVHCGIKLSRPKTNKITTTLSVGGNQQVKRVLDWLYQDATIFLDRKYEKYTQLRDYCHA